MPRDNNPRIGRCPPPAVFASTHTHTPPLPRRPSVAKEDVVPTPWPKTSKRVLHSCRGSRSPGHLDHWPSGRTRRRVLGYYAAVERPTSSTSCLLAPSCLHHRC
ncbi:unnamed protein product [Ectocarpus fasciculatus]